MKNLLRSDLFRVKKDKGLFIAFIVLLGCVALFALLYLALRTISLNVFQDNLKEAKEALRYLETYMDPSSLSYEDERTKLLNDIKIYLEGIKDMKSTISGMTVIQLILDINGYGGLLLPIFLAVFVCKDFRFNTIRNKIAAGYSRKQIYFSHLITSLIAGYAIILITGIFASIFGGIVFSFKEYDIVYLIQVFGMSLVLYTVLLSLTTFIAMWTNGFGAVLGVSIGLSLLFSILLTIGLLANVPEAFSKCLDFFIYPQSTELFTTKDGLDIFDTSSLSLVTLQEGYSGFNGRMFLITSLSAVFFTAGFTALGAWVFSRKELK